MEERFQRLKRMKEKSKIGIWCENPIILSCLKQIFSQDNSNIEIIQSLNEDNSAYEKVFIFGVEEKKFQDFKKDNFYFLKSLEEIFKNYEEKSINYEHSKKLCFSLSKLLDLAHNFPIERKANLIDLCKKLGNKLNLNQRDMELLKLSIYLHNVKNYLIEYCSKKSDYATQDITPTKRQNLIYEFFNDLPKSLLDYLFPPEEKNAPLISKIINVCNFYLDYKDIQILRKESDLDPFIVENLISIIEEKKIDLGKIIIVDSESDAPLIKLRLENQGLKVLWCDNGLQALNFLEKEKFDLILSNTVLAGMDGYSFLDRIKMNNELQNIPFIFISSRSDSIHIRKALALGANDFLSKPLDMEVLVTKINRLLKLGEKAISFERVQLSEIYSTPTESITYNDLKPNYIIKNRFQILQKIGEGGMGVLYLGKDLELGEEVVLKFLKETLVKDRTMLEKFKEEIRIARKLTHPSIVKIFDFWEIGELKFMTQEYIEGRTLREVLQKNGPFPIPIGLKYAREITKAFSYGHSMGILHRDIKPENIMLTQSNEIKILDFGIAKLFIEASNRRITSHSGDTFGTPEYMSPEQLSSRSVDVRSDIYSLGILFYEMFCGQLPFIGKSKISVALMQIQNKPIPPTNINPKIPLELENIISKMLEKSKEKRPQRMEEVEKALLSVQL